MRQMTAMFFCQQIQAAIDQGHLAFKSMQIDQQPFPMNVIDLQGAKVLVRPHQAESTKGKNVIIGKERSEASKEIST